MPMRGDPTHRTRDAGTPRPAASVPTTKVGSIAPRPAARHGAHASLRRAGYEISARAPRACSTTVPHIATAPTTDVAAVKTCDAASASGLVAAYRPHEHEPEGAGVPGWA